MPPREISNEEAYLAMHTLRLEYATGTYDNDPVDLERVKNVLPDVDGKTWYGTLDPVQVDQLGLAFSLYLSDAEKASVKSKHPTIDWDAKYSQEAFLEACKDVKDQAGTIGINLGHLLQGIGGADLSSRGWKEFAKLRARGLPVGLYVKECVELARGF